MLSHRSRWAAIPRGIGRPTFPATEHGVPPNTLATQYRSAFRELWTAISTYQRAEPGLDRAEPLRALQAAYDAAETLVRSHQLKTRQEAIQVGALRSGAVYLDTGDKARLEEARRILKGS